MKTISRTRKVFRERGIFQVFYDFNEKREKWLLTKRITSNHCLNFYQDYELFILWSSSDGDYQSS